jgi:hypothetical protein
MDSDREARRHLVKRLGQLSLAEWDQVGEGLCSLLHWPLEALTCDACGITLTVAGRLRRGYRRDLFARHVYDFDDLRYDLDREPGHPALRPLKGPGCRPLWCQTCRTDNHHGLKSSHS